jgi:biopolymer transport protein ExbB/TolQ
MAVILITAIGFLAAMVALLFSRSFRRRIGERHVGRALDDLQQWVYDREKSIEQQEAKPSSGPGGLQPSIARSHSRGEPEVKMSSLHREVIRARERRLASGISIPSHLGSSNGTPTWSYPIDGPL